MDLVTCFKCRATFEAEPWEPGTSPHCHAHFYWVEECFEDYSDCWAEIWFHEV